MIKRADAKISWYTKFKLRLSKWFSYTTIDDPLIDTLKTVYKVFIPLSYKFYYHKEYRSYNAKIIDIKSSGCAWKDKFRTPRYEGYFYNTPSVNITFFQRFEFGIKWYLNDDIDEDKYWEQYLWYKYYSNADIQKARETWPWTTLKKDGTWVNSWDESYVNKKYKI